VKKVKQAMGSINQYNNLLHIYTGFDLLLGTLRGEVLTE
jgi:hypothetical protein